MVDIGSTIPIKIFISYSHFDVDLRRELVRSLAMLRQQELVEVWYDEVGLMPGDIWYEIIINELEEADIILLLVSPDFLESAFAFKEEATKAIALAKEGKTRLVPIIARTSDWDHEPLKCFNVLPREMPVTEFESRDKGWLKVSLGVRKVVEALIVKPKPSQTPPPPESAFHLVIKNLPAGTEEGSLLRYLRQHGKVHSVRLRGGSGQDSMIADIYLEDPRSVNDIRLELDNKYYKDKILSVSFLER